MSMQISRCGYRCDQCLAYRPWILSNPETAKKLSDGWFKYYGFSIAPEAIVCDGCLAENARLVDATCPVRQCVVEHGFKNCAQCDQYACEKLQERLVEYEEVKQRLQRDIPEEDYRAFIQPYENKIRLDVLRDPFNHLDNQSTK